MSGNPLSYHYKIAIVQAAFAEMLASTAVVTLINSHGEPVGKSRRDTLLQEFCDLCGQYLSLQQVLFATRPQTVAGAAAVQDITAEDLQAMFGEDYDKYMRRVSAVERKFAELSDGMLKLKSRSQSQGQGDENAFESKYRRVHDTMQGAQPSQSDEVETAVRVSNHSLVSLFRSIPHPPPSAPLTTLLSFLGSLVLHRVRNGYALYCGASLTQVVAVIAYTRMCTGNSGGLPSTSYRFRLGRVRIPEVGCGMGYERRGGE